MFIGHPSGDCGVVEVDREAVRRSDVRVERDRIHQGVYSSS